MVSFNIIIEGTNNWNAAVTKNEKTMTKLSQQKNEIKSTFS